MGVRAPLLTFSLAAGILLAGTGFGLRARSPAAIGPVAHQAALVDAHAAAVPASAVEVAVAAPAPALPAPKEAPASAVLPEMKHVWQSLNNCGPAAVVMALSTFGVDTDQEVARLALRGPDVRRGMGPQGVDPWVKDNFGLRSMWRNDGTNDLMRRLVANGFAPMVTQWMQDPTVSRIAHWRTVRGYDDARGVFYVNDSMLGNMVPLTYDWFARNWQSFQYRYMVIYRAEDEPLLRAIVGKEWSEMVVRQSLYERARAEAIAQGTTFAWLAYGEAAYANGVFDEAVAAFEKGFSSGSAAGVFGVRSSYPQALRALGRKAEADKIAQTINGITPVPSTVAPAPDSYALFLALRRATPFEKLPTD
ncbi:MAG TPA: hypothetical protein VFC31_13355 [Candidatus Limnocylindria bacterium]|nr:hypothetical protein [Candidatus Limnocylindria bacterium]